MLLRTAATHSFAAFVFLVLFAPSTSAMRGFASLAGNLALFCLIHGSETSSTVATAASFLILLAPSTSAVRSFASLASDFAAFLLRHSGETSAAITTTAAFLILLAPSTSTVRSFASLAGDLALFGLIHGGETSAAVATATAFFVFTFLVVATSAAVRGLAALAGDLSLLLFIHGREASRTSTMSVGRLAMAMSHPAVAFTFFFVTGFVMPGCLTMVMGCRLMIECGVAMMGRQASLPTNLRHVFTVATYRLAALPAGFGSFFGGEFMGSSLLMGGPSAFAGNLSLTLFIHDRKSSFFSTCHDRYSLKTNLRASLMPTVGVKDVRFAANCSNLLS